MRRWVTGLSILSVSILATAGPVGAQSPGAGPTITQVVGGLDAPRGIAIAADGTLYVAEAGAGGTAPCVEHPELGHLCFGPTSGISTVKGGVATRLVDGLPSATNGSDIIGASGVTLAADGSVWFLVGGPGAGAADGRAGVPDSAAAGMGQLYHVDASGKAVSVADLAAYETASNPDKDQPGNTTPDSNANGLTATTEGAAIADAGGNDLLLVDGTGAISVAAVFPVVFQAAPADPTASPAASPQMVPMDPVPTSVVVGPDGAYYVGQLTGFPFPPGGASVFKVVPGQDPTVYASGFTNIIGLAFGADGALYVAEISKDGLLNAAPGGPPMGALLKVPAGGGTPEVLVGDGLPMPGGVAVATDGTIYVTTCASCPEGMGGVVSIKP
jgi:sugar lactone lactonase YvrE